MTAMAAPLVSIGWPVQNREGLVCIAVELVLCQSFGDFELRPRTSAKDTPAGIGASAAIGNAENIGVSDNHNRTFELSTGYFQWMGSDNSLDPRFLERCVAVLEVNPDPAGSHWASAAPGASELRRGDPASSPARARPLALSCQTRVVVAAARDLEDDELRPDDVVSPTLTGRGRVLERRLFGGRLPLEEIGSGVPTAPE